MCNCDWCARYKEIRRQISALPEDANEFFTNMMYEMMQLDEDLEYHKAIINGSWEGADDIIRRARRSNVPI